MKKHILFVCLILHSARCATWADEPSGSVAGEAARLQQAIDSALPGATILCDTNKEIEVTTPLTIRKAITLQGLNARLPKKLGRTSLIVVEAPGVTLAKITLRGNYASVHQKDRAALVRIHAGDFRVEDCTFFDSTKDGNFSISSRAAMLASCSV